jgi:hypothetical protein
MPRRTTVVATLAAALWALLSAAGASAQDLESAAPRALEPDNPDVAIAEMGHQVLVFTGRAGQGFAVLARTRPRAGGPWSAPTRLSATSAKRPSQPAVAIRRDGAAVAVWRGPGGTVLSALRPGPSAAWVRLSVTAAAGDRFVPDVALGGATATAAWGEGSGTGWRARFATLDVASRTWLVGSTLAIDGPPSVAVGAGGDVSATWVGADSAVRAALRPSGATGWESPAQLGATGAGPATAVAPSGAAVVAWQGTRVRAAVRPAGAASWPAAEDLGQGSVPVPNVAINTAEDAAATWLAFDAVSVDMRQRSGADGIWGPRITLDRTALTGGDGAPAALDELGNSFFAWIDPEGPGAATLSAWVGPTPEEIPLRSSFSGDVGGDLERVVLVTDGRGDALVASTRSLPFGELSTDIAVAPVRRLACAEPPPEPIPSPPDTITLSVAQLRVNQRISSAAIRRADAIEEWLSGPIESRDICGGGVMASTLGPGLETGPLSAPRTISTPDPRPLVIAPAMPDPDANFTLSATQLKINQRIASRAVRQANALQERLDRGLSGGDLADDAITARTLGVTIALTEALPFSKPPPTRTVVPPPADKDVTFTLSAQQLAINQRISQAAIERLNALRSRLATGLTTSDLRAETVTAANLAPGAVHAP